MIGDVRLIAPDVICHLDSKGIRKAIYAADLQPNKMRLSTAGGDASVKIWNVMDLINNPSTSKESLLATLNYHSNSVNAVRWSHCGKYLASASDDCYILIYRQAETGITTQPFGSKAVDNKENWNRHTSLRGHSMDVLDVCWSSFGLLASASIDNKILIWDMRSLSSVSPTCTPIHILSGHTSFVKGVAFDPIGRYLASAGADDLVIVWNCDTWKEEKRVDAAGLENTIFRRLSWAPDGSSLCVSAATRACKPVGLVLKRGTWQSVVDLVGHDSQATCCRFFPAVVALPSHPASQAGVGCIVALGDQRGTVSIWSTSQHQPLLVLQDTFPSASGAVLDISFCSISNSICGSMLSAVAAENHFKSLYGRGPLDQNLLLSSDSASIAEGHVVLKYREATSTPARVPLLSNSLGPTGKVTAAGGGAGSGGGTGSAPNSSMTSFQNGAMTVAKNGKKRVQPTLVSSSGGSTQRIGHFGGDTDLVGTSVAPSDSERKSHAQAPLSRHSTSVDVESVYRYSKRIQTMPSIKVPLLVGKRISGEGDSLVDPEIVARVKSSISLDGSASSNTLSGRGILSIHNESPPVPVLKARVVSMSVSHAGKAAGESKSSLPALSTVTCCLSPSSSSFIWQSFVTGKVVCLAGAEFEPMSVSVSVPAANAYERPFQSGDGVCVAGCSEGSLYVLSRASGFRLAPPIIVGSGVLAVLCTALPAREGVAVVRFGAISADGNLFLWECSNKASSTTNLLLDFKLVIRVSLDTALLSIATFAHPPAAHSSLSDLTECRQVTLMEARMDHRGDVTVCLQASNVWQAFRLDIAGQVWLRVADLSTPMSEIFVPKRSLEAVDLSSPSYLQWIASNMAQLDVPKVVGLARARMENREGANLLSLQATLAHIDDCLSSALASCSQPDELLWVGEWTQLCCRLGYLERITWLVDRLLNSIPCEGSTRLLTSTASQRIMHLIKDVILPSVAISGAERSQTLVLEIDDAIENLRRI